ncbi:MAG: UDP-3-O-acyl-N-acetylglucosamine deacetylase [Myxococcota bacterium]
MGARTCGFTEDIERLRRSGRALGGGLHNAVVFDASGVVNAEGLRDPSEVALHKLLDAWGDLSLFGMPWRGRYIGHRSGHALNVALVMRALTTKGAVRIESPAPLRVFREKAVAS